MRLMPPDRPRNERYAPMAIGAVKKANAVIARLANVRHDEHAWLGDPTGISRRSLPREFVRCAATTEWGQDAVLDNLGSTPVRLFGC